MPKKNTLEKVRTLTKPAVPNKPAIETKASRKSSPPQHKDATATESPSQFPAGFENKAGRYELIRIDGGQAYYSFTNRQEKTVDAAMPIFTWRKMQKRAEAEFKETA